MQPSGLIFSLLLVRMQCLQRFHRLESAMHCLSRIHSKEAHHFHKRLPVIVLDCISFSFHLQRRHPLLRLRMRHGKKNTIWLSMSITIGMALSSWMFFAIWTPEIVYNYIQTPSRYAVGLPLLILGTCILVVIHLFAVH